MSNTSGALTRTIDQLRECNTPDAIWAVVKARAERLGLSAVMITKGAQVFPFAREMAVHDELPPGVMARLEANALASGRIRKRVMLRSFEPFLVSRHSSKARGNTAAAWYGMLRRLLSKEAMLVVPVHHGETMAWIASFAGEAASFDPLARSILVVLVYAAYARAREVVASKKEVGRPRLSARERACVSGIARGQSAVEISKLLKISPRTVRFHLDNARTKLGVVTRMQAVRKAVRQGLIDKSQD